MKVCFNGAVMDEREAKIPVSDRGVLFGDGLFETLRAYQGRPFRLERHLERMREGCRALRLDYDAPSHEISGAVSDLYRCNVVSGDAYVRITVTGGHFEGSRTLERSSRPNVFIVVKPFEGYPEEYYRRGMRVIISRVRANESSPLSGIKSNNYLVNLLRKQEAKDRGADDAVTLNGAGFLAEGTSANLFMARRGKLLTPALSCGILPGITREAVLEICEEYGIPCETGDYLPDELRTADEAFFSVSTGEIVPIGEVEGNRIGFRCPGPLTTRIADAYRALVRRELSL
ncbi:MAG: branched-chain amino acid aminotransferase [Actinobacteria bacterium]|nr:branched-chain amino acid aminotransferase [Actinomycetota bacterium]